MLTKILYKRTVKKMKKTVVVIFGSAIIVSRSGQFRNGKNRMVEK